MNELLDKWSITVTETLDRCFTWTEPMTLAYLSELASKSRFAIEVGVYMGASSYALCRANDSMHLWSVDPFMVAGTEFVTRQNLARFIQRGQCELIPKTSPEAGLMLQYMKGKIDLCWVDDGHLEEDVLRDIDSFYPLLRSGGVICGHDLEHPDNDVTRAVRKRFPHFSEPVPRVWSVTK